MIALRGPVVLRPEIHVKGLGSFSPKVGHCFGRVGAVRGAVFGSPRRCLRMGSRGCKQSERRSCVVYCSFSSSSDGSGSMAENFHESDEEYVNSRVMEAVEVGSGSDGFFIKMQDGQQLKCIHNNPQGGFLPEFPAHSAIVLKMEDGSGLLLPIIVLEMSSLCLMAAMRNDRIVRPNVYHVIKEMIDKMGYRANLVRVTKRIHEAYFARLYLTKIENGERICFDLRPSDAINIAVICQVPIQVRKQLAIIDGVRVVEPSKNSARPLVSDGLLFTEFDRPDGQPCLTSQEFDLVRNMHIAAVEERYCDAAQWRDKLDQFRSGERNGT